MSSAPAIPLARRSRRAEHLTMKKASRPRTHESREDRARTLAGKTTNSKVRSEGRALAAQERSAKKKRAYGATSAKKRR
jgi:hypothetical protein